MECKTQTVEMRVVEATPGHLLHRKDEPLETAYFTPKVYLGTGDSPENYVEIPEEEAQAEMRLREREAAKSRPEEEDRQEAGEQ